LILNTLFFLIEAIFVSFGHINYQQFLIVKQLIQRSKFHHYEVIIKDFS